MNISHQPITWQQLNMWSRGPPEVQIKHQKGQQGWFYLLEFSHTTICGVYRECLEKEKVSSKQQFSGRKCLDVGGQRRTTRRLWAELNSDSHSLKPRYAEEHLRTVNTEPGCTQATAAEDHTVLRTGNWAYSFHTVTKAGRQKTEKMWPESAAIEKWDAVGLKACSAPSNRC